MARRREEESSLSGYEHEFLRASEELKTAALRNEVYLSDAQKIKFYALFKQATDGDCTKPQPSAFKPVERAKWNGWKGLEGMDMTVAKRRYVLQVIELVPSFKMPTEKVQDQAIVEEPTAPAAQAAATPESVPTVAVAATSAPTEPAPSPARDDSLPDPPQPSRPVVRGSATTRQASLIERHQRRADVPSLSYPLILLEMLAFVLGATILLLGGTKFLVPLCNQVAMEHFGVESCDGLKSLAPVFWFSLGYGLVAVLRGKVFQWRLLTGQFVWVSATSPLRRLRRFRRREQQQESPEELEKARFLQELGIHLVKKPEGPHDRWVTPRLELLLPSDPDALSCGHATVELPYTLEQTADVFYRKFKEPLPDPANEMLVGLDDVDEQHFDEWEAVYRRRAMRFRNVTPTMFKRFVNSEFIEYVEHSLFDKRNRVFYVYAKNVSFQNMGFIEDYSIYHATEGKPEWTTLTQFARVHITSSSVGFFRSQIESFISSVYGKQATKARAYHLLRLQEECGDPQGLPVPPRAESA